MSWNDQIDNIERAAEHEASKQAGKWRVVEKHDNRGSVFMPGRFPVGERAQYGGMYSRRVDCQVECDRLNGVYDQ